MYIDHTRDQRNQANETWLLTQRQLIRAARMAHRQRQELNLTKNVVVHRLQNGLPRSIMCFLHVASLASLLRLDTTRLRNGLLLLQRENTRMHESSQCVISGALGQSISRILRSGDPLDHVVPVSCARVSRKQATSIAKRLSDGRELSFRKMS